MCSWKLVDRSPQLLKCTLVPYHSFDLSCLKEIEFYGIAWCTPNDPSKAKTYLKGITLETKPSIFFLI